MTPLRRFQEWALSGAALIAVGTPVLAGWLAATWCVGVHVIDGQSPPVFGFRSRRVKAIVIILTCFYVVRTVAYLAMLTDPHMRDPMRELHTN